MTDFAITAPYLRTTPVRIPRRDIVLGGSDSLELSVTVVESDNPGAPPLDLTGGLGGPALTLAIWPSNCYRNAWDYGAPWTTRRSTLWSGTATVIDAASGTFAFTIPIASATSWPLRCDFALYLNINGGLSSQALAEGVINFGIRFGAAVSTADVITTDALDPITTD